MATFIKVKRSSTTPTATPSNLRNGEFAHSYGAGTYTDFQTTNNGAGNIASGGKLFIGQGTEDGSGHAANIDVIGGKYFTDMLDHGHGTLTANSALIVDQSKKLDELNVDNINFNLNTISTTNSNGDLIFDPAGSGSVVVVDDTFLAFGSDEDGKIEYDENSTDKVQVTGANWKFNCTVEMDNIVIGPGSPHSFDMPDNTATALKIHEGSNNYLVFTTTDSSELITFSSADVDIDNDLNVDGGDITTNATTFNLLNANATTVNAFGAATAIDMGATSGTATINNPTLVGTQATQNLYNSAATTMNFAGAAATLNMGANSGTATIGNPTVVGTQTTQNLYNTTATTMNFAGAATTINMGTNSTTLDLGDIRIKGNTISTDSNSATELVIDPFPDAGDAGGDVIIRGNLQVAGTTTTVNSSELSVNDPIFTVGDTVSSKTVVSTAASGQNQVIVDNPSSVVEGATITGTGIATSTTISNVEVEFNTNAGASSNGQFGTAPSAGDAIYFYDGTLFSQVGTFVSQTTNAVKINLIANISLGSDNFYDGGSLSSVGTGTPTANQKVGITKVSTKVFKTTTFTLSNNTTSSIAVDTQLTISQAVDDNLDRGIQFKYLKSNSSKVGFFGYDDSNDAFVFIKDGTNNSNLFSGTRGEGWFKTIKVDDGVHKGIAYFDSDLKITRTVAAGSADVDTSFQILTATSGGVPTWTTTIDGGTYT
tara:strand:+ start:12480 stop:14615 length:2136 start_codon:yes stop_codon:yes gene_type:complete